VKKNVIVIFTLLSLLISGVSYAAGIVHSHNGDATCLLDDTGQNSCQCGATWDGHECFCASEEDGAACQIQDAETGEVIGTGEVSGGLPGKMSIRR
jgi:hypothetical protein